MSVNLLMAFHKVVSPVMLYREGYRIIEVHSRRLKNQSVGHAEHAVSVVFQSRSY